MAVIYRKYRPQTFFDLTGQEHVRKILMEQIIRGTVAHAYLFTGPRGVGKTTSARLLAKAINCTGRKKTDAEPCAVCDACKLITDGRALDVMEIDAASHTGVDNIRETVIETARFAPSQLAFKVFIIDEVHMLSSGAWNALLKIIEEPPKHVVFVLATTEVHKVPATILSRCQRFDFKRVTVPLMVERLTTIAKAEGVSVDEAVLAQVARLAEGGLRDAETLLGQIMALGLQHVTVAEASLVIPVSALPRVIDFLNAVLQNNAANALQTVSALLDDGFDLYQFGREAIEVVRQLMLIKLTGKNESAVLFDETTAQEIAKLVAGFSPAKIHWILEVLNRRVPEIKHASILQLPLELAVFEICLPEGERTLAMTPPPIVVQEVASGARVADVETGDVAVKEAPPLAAEIVVVSDDVAFLGQLRAAWDSVVGKVAATNPSLPFVLQMSEPVSINNNVVTIGVRYPFHRDKLNEEKNRQFMETLLTAEFARPLRIEGVLLPKKEADGMVDEALSVFGGIVLA